MRVISKSSCALLCTLFFLVSDEWKWKRKLGIVAAFTNIPFLYSMNHGIIRKNIPPQFMTEILLQSSSSNIHTSNNDRRKKSKYLKVDKSQDKGMVELPSFFMDLVKNEHVKQSFILSKQILYECEQVDDRSTLENIIGFLISRTISLSETKPEDNDDIENKMNTSNSIYLASLLTPRDQTDLIRILGSRGMYYTMLCFLKHLALNVDQQGTDTGKEDIHSDIQYAYTAAITALAKSSNPKYRMRTTLLLDEMDELGIQPNSYVITAVFLAIEGGKAARELIKRTRGYKNIEVDVRIYNAAIYACSRGPSNGWQTALSLFREMPSNAIIPDQQTYASLLQACTKSGQVKVAFSLFDEMRNTPGMSRPGPKVWGAILRACSIVGDWEKVIKLILTMDNEGEKVNVIHMNSALSTLAKIGDDMIALEVLDRMQNNEPISVLKTLVECHRGKNDLDFHKGKQNLPYPDLVSVNTVLTAFVERNRKVEAMKLLNRMKNGEFTYRQGTNWITIKPDIISYNLVLSTFQKPQDAMELLHEIRMTRKTRYNPLKPTCQTYVNAISICSRSSPPRLDIALTLLNDARVKDGLKPNEFMYSAVIWTAERSADTQTAIRVLNEMYEERCKPNTICYNGVLATLAKNGMFQAAKSLFHEMKRKYVPTSSTTFQQLALAAARSNIENSIILDGLEEILATLSKQEQNVEESGAIYNALIRGYGSIGKFDDSMRIFNSLERSNTMCLCAILFVCSISTPARWNEALLIIHTSDIVAGAEGPGNIESTGLSYAIIACSKENQWGEALNLLDLYGAGYNRGGIPTVSVDAINSVIAAAGRNGRPDVAMKLLNEMISKYLIQPNERSFRSVIIACNQAEHEKRRQRQKLDPSRLLQNEIMDGNEDDSFYWWEAALSLLRRMKENGIKPSIQTYSCVIAACEAAGQWQRAIGILRSMTQEKDESFKPNLYCYNAALAACEKGNAWLEALQLYERMKAEGGAVKPNFISLNSLLIVLEKVDQRELAENIYKEALREKLVNPWKGTTDSKTNQPIRALDLHKFSIPMAKIAVRNILESLLKKEVVHDIENDLIIIIGKGKGSIDGKTKLLNPIKALLQDEFDMIVHTEKTNIGRLRIETIDLKNFVSRKSWQ